MLDTLPIIGLVDKLIEHAHDARASDIHIDPAPDVVRVRFRVDGVMAEKYTFEKKIHNEVISRIKILSGLRTDEHQAAQDGRFRSTTIENHPIDIRVSIAPTYYGENAVLRLLSDHAEEFNLETLGFSAADKKKVERAIGRPHGMILATGPTGSGKTTTLYSILKILNTPDVSIVTIEDPIEYAVTGIEQIQVNPRTGLTFANGLRSILRQDPNIIMVGEIRDSETASIAVNTALTGHLLLSTLHTNDAATTVARLLDMGVEPFLVASTVNLAVGQRLVRRICAKCQRPAELSEAEQERLHELGINIGLEKTQHGVGCEYCGGSGFSGRVSINEVLAVDNDIREAILHRATATEIKQIAVRNGMTTMLDDGITKVQSGQTTVAEILRVVHD